MKGKKFDAHEKHFKGKEAKLNNEIKYLKERYQDVCADNLHLSVENEQLRKENIDIKSKYQKLLEYSKLSSEDIVDALERDKSANKLAVLFDKIPTYI